MIKLVVPIFSTLLIFACGESSSTQSQQGVWVDNQNFDPPQSILDLGLYTDKSKGKQYQDFEISSRMLEYELDYPLYSDSLSKRRHLFLPEGTKLNINTDGEIEYPEGSVLFKTFLRNEEGQQIPVETRVLFYQELKWKNRTYEWKEGSKDAQLMDGRGAEINFNHNGRQIEYSIPNKLECNNCHNHSKGHILGFKQMEVSRGSGGDNEKLWDDLNGSLTGKKNWSDPCIDQLDGKAKAAVGYIQGNCSHCHSEGHVTFQTTKLDLSPCGIEERIIGLDPSIYSETDQEMKILHPGRPEKSLIYILMDAKQADFRTPMPPIGVRTTHQEGMQTIREWIEGL